MNCPKCGAPVAPGTAFCSNCGASVSAPAPAPQPVAQPIPQQNTYNTYPATPVYPASAPVSQVPPEYKPLSPWAYFGYMLLFSIPIVGFICLIIFSVDSGNINRRNFARSYWIWFVIGMVIGIIVFVLTAVFRVSLANEVNNFSYF
ncbi:MAG: zinc ribbon domain-containing protein [Clostridia bacterium]|nr:zinc ribbon domain-containing protein [Clostridia bacterium]